MKMMIMIKLEIFLRSLGNLTSSFSGVRGINNWGLKNFSRLLSVSLGGPNHDRAMVPRTVKILFLKAQFHCLFKMLFLKKKAHF